jgi:enoyl-CoA hydratase/carnithine racemase
MELALCMHYLVADPNASMCLPEMRFGFTPPAAIPLLINRVGVQEAYAICADARPMTAREAYQRGLVDRLVAVGRARETAIAMARRLADRQATTALRLARTLVGFDMRAAVDTSFAEWHRLVGSSAARASVDDLIEQHQEQDSQRDVDD